MSEQILQSPSVDPGFGEFGDFLNAHPELDGLQGANPDNLVTPFGAESAVSEPTAVGPNTPHAKGGSPTGTNPESTFQPGQGTHPDYTDTQDDA